MNKATRLAKLARPRVFNAVLRERLFAKLDVASEKPIVWVSSPPGAGKTTLVATFVEARRRPYLWYQLDAGDKDPATLFHYLVELSRQVSKLALPHLTPEFLADISGFARRFFRQLFAAVPDSAILVLDNYQDAACDVTHRILRDAVTELPEGVNIIVLSRMQAPAEFARLIASGALSAIDWNDLRLTVEECQSIVDDAVADDHQARALHARADGWVAGVKLLLASVSRLEHASFDELQSKETIFNYFAGELFDQADAADQAILLTTALLPEVTPQAAISLSGDPRAPQYLEGLYKRQYFVDRRTQPSVSYRYHDLFREFLLARGKATLTRDDQRERQVRAAEILALAGDKEAAIGLFLEVESFMRASTLILHAAPSLLGQGRWQTLLDWLNALPRPVLDDQPWIEYWRGMALLQTDLRNGREALVNVHARFKGERDSQGQSLAAASIINSIYFEYDDFTRMDPWLAVIDGLLESEMQFPDRESELYVYAAMLLGSAFRRPEHAFLAHYARHVTEQLDFDIEADRCVAAGLSVLSYCTFAAEFDLARRLVTRIRPLVEKRAASPLYQAYWWIFDGYLHHLTATREGLEHCLRRADQVASEHGLTITFFLSRIFLAYHHCCHLESAEAKGALAPLEALLGGARPMDAAQYHLAMCSISIVSREFESASRHAKLGVAQLGRLGAPCFDAIWYSLAPTALVLNGEYALADDWLRRASQAAERGYLSCYRALISMSWAHLEHRQGNYAQRDEHLRSSIAASHEGGAEFLRWMLSALPELFAIALEIRCQPDYISKLIKRLHISPPARAPESWPWLYRVYTLGKFEIQRDGQAIRFSRKAPKRVLQLLKAIVALGDGASATNVSQRLWPDAEGDAAHEALAIALHRLRSLLGRPDAVLLIERKLHLNRSLVWVDAWSFEEGSELPAETADAARVLGFYRGAFLPQDAEDSWTIGYRDRLKSRFVRAVLAVVADFERQGDLGAALALVQRGTEMDPLAEELCRACMRCCLKLDRRAEGMAAFHRFRRLLSITLGVEPARHTQELAQQLSEF